MVNRYDLSDSGLYLPAGYDGGRRQRPPGLVQQAAGEALAPGAWEQIKRFAGDKPAQWLSSMKQPIRGLTPGMVLKGGTLAAGIPVVMELLSDRPADEKVARAAGSTLSIPAAALGFALGGGPTPMGIALATLFGGVGSSLGSEGAEAGLNLLKGGPEDQAARAAIKQAETQAKMADILLPAEQRRMQAAIDTEIARAQGMAPILNDQRMRQALASQALALQNANLQRGLVTDQMIAAGVI